MGESRWDRERRHLNEDHQARRKQSKLTMDLLKSQARVDRLTGALEPASPPAPSSEVSQEFIRLGVEWMHQKTAILAEISGNRFLSDETKAAWSGVLRRVTLTDGDDTPLTDLRLKMMLESARFDGRVGRCASLTALGGKLSKLIETRAEARGHL